MTVGVFDSGVGGLSVLRELRAALPEEDLVYAADTAWCPYGPRSDGEIGERADALTRALLDQGADVVVVACNTATIAALDWLRERFSVPFVGVEPAVKPAAAQTRSGVIGVLATVAALAGPRFRRLVEAHAGDRRVLSQPLPGLVERIEDGDLDGPETRAIVAAAVAPLVAGGADQIVLGCTHYPLIAPVIAEAAGPGATLVDSGAAVARQTARVLDAHGLRGGSGAVRFLSSDPEAARTVISRLWGEPVAVGPVGAAPAARK